MSTLHFPIDGFRAAEEWHVLFCAAADAAEGYLFPSGLRQAFDLVPTSAQSDFLDAIGALLVNFQVIGMPMPGCQDLQNDVYLHAMSPQMQDEWGAEQERVEALGDAE